MECIVCLAHFEIKPRPLTVYGIGIAWEVAAALHFRETLSDICMLARPCQILCAIVDAESPQTALEGLEAHIELRGHLDRCLGQATDQH